MKDIQQEIVPLNPEDFFLVLNHPDAKFDYPVHYHSAYEINLVMRSHGQRIVGDSCEEFGDLDLVFIGPNIPHAWKGEIEQGNHVITIQFSADVLNLPILEKRLFAPIKQLLHESVYGLCYTGSDCQRIADRIVHITQTQGFQSVLDFFSILYGLSNCRHYNLVSNKYDSAEVVRTTKSRRIAKVLAYLEDNYYDTIKLGDVAAITSMSDSAFSHFFKKKTNMSFVEYLNNFRVAKACEQLVDTSKTVAEICYTTGFNNMSNFIRIFKRNKGQTPNEYRNFIRSMLIKY